jgi:hypothetical protein
MMTVQNLAKIRIDFRNFARFFCNKMIKFQIRLLKDEKNQYPVNIVYYCFIFLANSCLNVFFRYVLKGEITFTSIVIGKKK